MLHSHSGGFLNEVVGYEDKCDDPQEVMIFWSAPGLGGEFLDIAVDLDPFFRGGKLWVASHWEGHDTIDEQLSRLTLCLFKLEKITDSRWLTVGGSPRVLLSGLVMGLEPLVSRVRQDKSCTDFFLHGFSRLSTEVKEFSCLASIVSWVPDGFLSEAMEDDRLAQRVGFMKSVLDDELQWLHTLPDLLWSRLAVISGDGCDAAKLRSTALHAGGVAVGFVHSRVISVLEAYPWSLGRGDLDGNLQELEDCRDFPQELVASRVKRLLQAGCPWNCSGWWWWW